MFVRFGGGLSARTGAYILACLSPSLGLKQTSPGTGVSGPGDVIGQKRQIV